MYWMWQNGKTKLWRLLIDNKEKEIELYQDALQELDNIAAGDQDTEDFMNSYLVIQTALKVALGEENV